MPSDPNAAPEPSPDLGMANSDLLYGDLEDVVRRGHEEAAEGAETEATEGSLLET